jgi:predicted adenine nucleotide alpha hydrolase (AANH) superfamily ATPase
MKLLLHACCADCTLKFIASVPDISPQNFAVYYYNPNIHPRSEYQSRLTAIKKICLENKVKLIIPDWQPSDYFKVVKSSKNRCPHCWQLRLSASALFAQKNGYTHFSSTILTSHYQDQDKITKIAQNLSKKYQLSFYQPQKIIRDLKTSGFYKQFFCGCCYSLIERYQAKYSPDKL